MFTADTSASNQVINLNFARTGQPTFYYPTFWFTSSERTLTDAVLTTNFIGGTEAQETRTTKTGVLGDLNIDYTNNTGGTQFLWVAYPTGITTVTTVSIRTREGDSDSGFVNGSLSTASRSSTDLTFLSAETGAPASAAEDYQWFRIEVPQPNANVPRRVTIGATS